MVFRQVLGGLSAQERADRVNRSLVELARDPSLSVDDLAVYVGDKDAIPLSDFSVGNVPLLAISDADARGGAPPQRLTMGPFQKNLTTSIMEIHWMNWKA